ncbi:MAG: SUMF1/EgtB/PvdO family nonheme iron enzyme [Blastocatellia bacterium]
MRKAIISLLLMSGLGSALGSRQFEQQVAARASSVPTQAATSTPPSPFGRYTENINGVLLELVRAPQGTFLMGNDRSPNPEEKPAHQVNLRSFHIGQYEITRKQWNIVVDTLPKVNRDLRRQYTGPSFGGMIEETMPADVVFWDDAVEFCDRLTRFTGRRYRLPSEAEWEYACRAGTQTEFSFGNEVDYNLAHFKNLGHPSFYLLPVGAKGYANAWGLYDMHGNVAEWCLDVKHLDYIGAPTDGSVWTQGGDQLRRSQRGGMYDFREEFGRSSARLFWLRDVTASGFGFRVVAEISSVISNGRVTATSAASYSGATLATESIAALFGTNLSNDMQPASTLPLLTTLAGASVVIKDSRGNEFASSLFFASPNQINFQVPSGLALGTATISVVTNGAIGSTGAIELTDVSPGLFTSDASGKGLPAALILRVKSNGEQVYGPVARFDQATKQFVAVPIDLGNPADQVFLLLFGTGFRNRSSLAAVTASVGGTGTQVTFAGAQGGLVGLDQCNLRLSPNLAGRGEVDINLTVDGKIANSVKIRVK